jgi:hypothetical protein
MPAWAGIATAGWPIKIMQKSREKKSYEKLKAGYGELVKGLMGC